jgi:hypothetical protein
MPLSLMDQLAMDGPNKWMKSMTSDPAMTSQMLRCFPVHLEGGHRLRSCVAIQHGILGIQGIDTSGDPAELTQLTQGAWDGIIFHRGDGTNMLKMSSSSRI